MMPRQPRPGAPERRTDKRALARFTVLWLLAGAAVAVLLVLAIDHGIL